MRVKLKFTRSFFVLKSLCKKKRLNGGLFPQHKKCVVQCKSALNLGELWEQIKILNRDVVSERLMNNEVCRLKIY